MQRVFTRPALVITIIASAAVAYSIARGALPHMGVVRVIDDPGAPAVTVRLLDVGQGDATYIRNGDSRVIIDGGPDQARFGKLLDSLDLNNTTIDVVILTHQHYDHYKGLLALFESRRHIKLRYFFENKDPNAASALAQLRDSILARMDHDGLIYRDTDDPCGNGRPVCTIAMRGGAKLDVLRPAPPPGEPNNRSVAVKLVGVDSASFTMWLAGDAEHDEIDYFERAGYALTPGMQATVMKADHHGSCNGVTARYLALVRPELVVTSLGAENEYGHMHLQAKATYTAAELPWYRTDQNGTITIRSSGIPGDSYTVKVDRGQKNMSAPSDHRSRQADCADM